MRQTPDLEVRLEAAMMRAIEELYPLDSETGLRIYNPEGLRVVNIKQLLEITDDETHSDCRADRTRPAEGHCAHSEAPQDDVERRCRDGAPRVRRRPHAGERAEGQPEEASVTDPDLNQRLDALARTLRRIARATTRLRRSVAADAQQLVDLEGAVDVALGSLRSLQRQIGEQR